MHKHPLFLTALYSSPRHNIKIDKYMNLLKKYDGRYIMGGDFNAKHAHWGSRLTTTKGRELLKAIQAVGCNIVPTGRPTYWPTDSRKLPDLLDLFIVNKLPKINLTIKDSSNLSSDHSPVLLTLYEKSII